MTTEFETEVEALYDAIDSLSDEFSEYLEEKTDTAALNWLRIYGIPQTPNDVWRIFSTLYRGIPANLIKDGKLIPAEGTVAPAAERAERKERRQKQAQLTFEDLLSKDEAGHGFGTYV